MWVHFYFRDAYSCRDWGKGQTECHFSGTIHIGILRKGLSLGRVSLSMLVRLPSVPWGSVYLHFPSNGITSTYHHAWIAFQHGFWRWNSGFLLPKQALYSLRSLPSPPFTFFLSHTNAYWRQEIICLAKENWDSHLAMDNWFASPCTSDSFNNLPFKKKNSKYVWWNVQENHLDTVSWVKNPRPAAADSNPKQCRRITSVDKDWDVLRALCSSYSEQWVSW